MLLTGNNPIEGGLGAFDYALYRPAEGKPGDEAYVARTTAAITCTVGARLNLLYLLAGYHASQARPVVVSRRAATFAGSDLVFGFRS
jgi:hypothetical protein